MRTYSQTNSVIINYPLLILIISWSSFTVWSQLTAYNWRKALSDESKMTQRLLQRNGTLFPMSGESSFTRGPLMKVIGNDGECEGVDKMLKGTYTQDTETMDKVTALTEMTSIIKALQIPVSTKTGESSPLLNTAIVVADYVEVFLKQGNQQHRLPQGFTMAIV